MKELEQILQLWQKTKEAGESAVLATVVKTHGSSYRLPGARLLLTESGLKAGSVSGGCLEDELVQKAWWFTSNGPLVRRYDTTPDGEIASEYGLGCNGIIHVLLERVTPTNSPVLNLLQNVRFERRTAALAHAIAPASAVSQHLLIDIKGTVTHNFSDLCLARTIETETLSAMAKNSSGSLLCDGVEVFVETLSPPIRLLVFGAGDDAIPVTEMARFLGWQVFVLDGRAHYARRDKFKYADQVIVLNTDNQDLASYVDSWTAAVLMTHSYSQDLDSLRHLASEPLRYLGILGPRKRSIQLLSDAGLPTGTLSDSLHSPMGLDIGADGPEQVAVSVLAEIQAALNGREGGSLAKRDGSIHSRETQALCDSDSEKFWVRSIVCA